MPLVKLTDVLSDAESRNCHAIGLVCQGWEDSRAYVEAGEAANAPVILSAGPSARRNMPVQLWGQMFSQLAEQANCPVVAHLDHGKTLTEIQQALDAGFSSVMFDGSNLPLKDNIATTLEAMEAARPYGASIEAEVGLVGYQDGEPSEGTTISDAEIFANACSVDALAISVGNLHLQTKGHATIDWHRLAAIEAVTTMPLVLHGGSGIHPEDRRRLARDHRVRKINLGTELRKQFGRSLRAILADDRALFDRTEIMLGSVSSMHTLAVDLLKASWYPHS